MGLLIGTSVFGGWLLLGSVMTYALLIAPWQRAREAASWPAVEATVLESRVDSVRGSDSTTYRPEIVYRYEVDGEPFESNVYDAHGAGFSNSDRSRAFEAVKANPAGATVTAYVDPADPSRAMLDREWSGGLMWLLVLLPAMGLLGLAGVVVFFVVTRA